MLIPFNQIVKKYGKPNGIIHIGAHLAEERTSYKEFEIENIVWIEANPEVFNKTNYLNSEKEIVLNYAISDVDNEIHEFNIASNGESSSLLELELHRIHHPHINVIKKIHVKTRRMDSIINELDLDLSRFNFINLDIQGVELKALKGFGNYLDKIDYIYTEVNSNYLYKDCSLIDDIDGYLSKFNFERIETSMTKFEWGDAFYVRRKNVNI